MILCSSGAVDSSVDWRTVCGAITRVISIWGAAGVWNGPALMGLTSGEWAPLPQAPRPGEGGPELSSLLRAWPAAVTGRTVAEHARDVVGSLRGGGRDLERCEMIPGLG